MKWGILLAFLAGCTYVYVQTGGEADQRTATLESQRDKAKERPPLLNRKSQVESK